MFIPSPYISPKKAPRTIVVKEKPKRPPKVKGFPCVWPGCDSAFSRKPDMFRHVRTTHEKRRDYFCNWPGCNKTFTQQGSLTNHENVHTGDKPWICPVDHCSAAFSDQSSCGRHYKEQHTNLTFYCPWCNSCNKRSTEFRNHLLKVHGVAKSEGFNIDSFKLPMGLTPDELEMYPQFTKEGMTGIEMRRKTPGRARCVRGAAAGIRAEKLLKPDVTPIKRAPSTDSLATTPALSSASSEAMLLPDVDPEVHQAFAQMHVSYNPSEQMHGNALQVNFGYDGQVYQRSTALPDSTVDHLQASRPLPYGGQHHAYFPLPQGWTTSEFDASFSTEQTLPSSYAYDINDYITHQAAYPQGPTVKSEWMPSEYMTNISQHARGAQSQAGWVRQL